MTPPSPSPAAAVTAGEVRAGALAAIAAFAGRPLDSDIARLGLALAGLDLWAAALTGGPPSAAPDNPPANPPADADGLPPIKWSRLDFWMQRWQVSRSTMYKSHLPHLRTARIGGALLIYTAEALAYEARGFAPPSPPA